MDKVQKIREEIERLKLCTMDEHMKFYSECTEAEYNALCKVEKIIDSLSEEPVKSLDVDEIKLILDINSDMQEELENSTMFPPEWAGIEKYYEELLKRYESRR